MVLLRYVSSKIILREGVDLTRNAHKESRRIVYPGKGANRCIDPGVGVTGVVLGADLDGNVSECGSWGW